MSKSFLNPLLTAEEVADTHRYGEDEYPTIDRFILGAQALLHNAGAFHPDNPMTTLAVDLIVGHWLENRDGMNYDQKNMHALPYSLKSIIYSLQYLGNTGEVNE